MLYNCLRRRLDTPKENTSTHLKRQAIIFVCNQAQFFHKYLHRYLFYEYNNPMVKKNFSLKTYLQWLAEEGTWGDEALLYIYSIMWNASVSIFFPKTIRALHLRHNIQDISKVAVLVLHTGGLNFTAVSKLWVAYAYNWVTCMASRLYSYTYGSLT